MIKSISLRTRITITVTLLIIILSSFLSIAIGQKSGKEVRNQKGSSLAGTAFHMADTLDQYMWSRSGEIEILKELETIKEPEDLSAIQNLLNQLKTSFPSFSWIGFTDSKGVVQAATEGILVGADISSRPVYQEGIKGHFIGDVHDAVLLAKLLPNPSGGPMEFVDISTPVYGKDGNLSGVLAAHLSWEWAKEVEESFLKPLQTHKQIELFIISQNENTVLLGPKEMIGQQLEMESIHEARLGKNDWALETWGDGRQYLTGYVFADGHMDYPGLGWTILVRQPVNIAYAPVRSLQLFILMVGIGFSVAFAIITWFMAGKIVQPLNAITIAADRLYCGEFVEIPQHKGIKDIEILSSSLRQLVSSLTQTESALGKMETLAHHDRLTGLPNRIALDLFVTNAKIKARREGLTLSFLYLDLDGFKNVNDTMGHHIGDLVLKETANRLKQNVRDNEIVVRLGGDEFVMVLFTPENCPAENAMVVSNRVIQALNEPFIIDDLIAKIGCSIGVAVWPIDGNELSDILRLADEALYDSKRAGKNQTTFFSLKTM